MPLFEQYQDQLNKAINATQVRSFYAAYPEHPKAYGQESPALGKEAFDLQVGKPFLGLLQTGTIATIGEEASPYLNQSLGIDYPTAPIATYIDNASTALKTWRLTSLQERTGILMASLDRIAKRFHEIAHATQHTTGQSYVMSFQASGPHAADRALETIAMAYQEMSRFPAQTYWSKPMGSFSINLDKQYHAIPKGVGLVIGCSTFPTWNSVPGIYANLMAGNPVIVKPHPRAVLPIAIFIAEIQKVLQEQGQDVNTIQLAADSLTAPITKALAEHSTVKLIDYTGSSSFGNYIESLNKQVFTEKSGINSVILDSMHDLRNVMRNLAFAVSLYSGQMCTAPQNFFIPATGVQLADGEVASYEQVVDVLKNEVAALALHPKMGAGTLGAIHSEATLLRAKNIDQLGGTIVLKGPNIRNKYFKEARICAPSIIAFDASDKSGYEQELFGPVIVVIKTESTAHSVALAKEMALKHGAITCAAYTTNEATAAHITSEMNAAFTPVSFNFIGYIWVNQHAAFSDFHVTGGNPSGNASFTDPSYITNRFVWVGNRRMA